MLLVTGHGWAKEAGMITPGSVHTNTIYAERKLDYGTLSRAALLEEDPSLFYGFWGWQYNKDLVIHVPIHTTFSFVCLPVCPSVYLSVCV